MDEEAICTKEPKTKQFCYERGIGFGFVSKERVNARSDGHGRNLGQNPNHLLASQQLPASTGQAANLPVPSCRAYVTRWAKRLLTSLEWLRRSTIRRTSELEVEGEKDPKDQGTLQVKHSVLPEDGRNRCASSGGGAFRVLCEMRFLSKLCQRLP